MKKLLVALAILLLGSIITLIGIHPVDAASSSSEEARLNNFSITSYTIDYSLKKEADGSSRLDVKETIVALFPLGSVNHGIERSIPVRYKHRALPLEIRSITNGAGEQWNFETRHSGDSLIARIGEKSTYVRGKQTFVIDYSIKNVTHYFADNDRDEWYWDTNGTAWKVPIDVLTVNITIDPELAAVAFDGARCYVGEEGSAATCQLEKTSPTTYTVTEKNLNEEENVTVAFGFPKNTFVNAAMTPLDFYLFITEAISLFVIPIGVVIGVLFGVQFHRRLYRTKDVGFTPVQYIPAKGISVLVAADALAVGSSFKKMPALLIDLAVRHYITLSELTPKTLFTTADYEIKIIRDVSGLLEEERELLSDMFGGALPAVGAALSLKSLKKDKKYALRLYDNAKKIDASLLGKYGIREKNKPHSRFILYWGISVIIGGAIILSIPLMVFGGIILIFLPFFRPLTDKGVELRRYLLGYITFIKAAEVDRLKLLQGPDTAEKLGKSFDGTNNGQLIKLYERSLPYAILFGLDAQWTKALADLYQQESTTPSWYVGQSAFNYAVFSSTISNFSTSAVSYGGTGSSASSGSSGGGFSGGGGGGGGGGGW